MHALLFFSEGLLSHQDLHVHVAVHPHRIQCCKLGQVQLLVHMVERESEETKGDYIGQLNDTLRHSLRMLVEDRCQDFEEMRPQAECLQERRV